MTEFTQLYLTPKIFLMGSSLAFSLKEDPVRCAKVCDKSWVTLKYLPGLVNIVKERSQRKREKKNLRLFFLLLFSEMRQFQIRTGLEHHEHTVCVWKAFTISGALFFLFTRTGCSVHWTSENLRKALLLSRNWTGKNVGVSLFLGLP